MLLQLNKISKGFGVPGDKAYRSVLKELSLGVERGESLAILGPSGSGKSTLLNIIGGLDHADAGQVLFDGKDITALDAAGLDRYRNEEIGFVFQFHHLLPQCNLLENVLIPTLAGPGGGDGKQERAEQLMKRVGIWELRDKIPAKLSGGECQRAAVVRAMINSPSILLADEPTGALDRDNVQAMADLLLELNAEEDMSLVVVTHSETLAAMMSRSLELESGRLKDE
jgi:ABC-type lipoprotein export system ATPase subunit